MKRLAIAAALFGLVALPAAAAGVAIEVNKTATCGCCTAWVEHLEENGFAPEPRDMSQGLLSRIKVENGVTPELSSCHTALVEGYVIEGHVPAEDIARLLEERPAAIGLTVPGMPMGSPGMEYGERRDAYDVLLIRKDGSTEVFTSYAAR